MFARHTRYRPLAQSMLLTYAAKKRAEVAPGVGTETDMFWVGPQLGTYTTVTIPMIKALYKMYHRNQRRIEKSNERAETEARQYVEEITRAAAVAQVQEAATEVSGGSSSDEENGGASGEDTETPTT